MHTTYIPEEGLEFWEIRGPLHLEQSGLADIKLLHYLEKSPKIGLGEMKHMKHTGKLKTRAIWRESYKYKCNIIRCNGRAMFETILLRGLT